MRPLCFHTHISSQPGCQLLSANPYEIPIIEANGSERARTVAVNPSGYYCCIHRKLTCIVWFPVTDRYRVLVGTFPVISSTLSYMWLNLPCHGFTLYVGII